MPAQHVARTSRWRLVCVAAAVLPVAGALGAPPVQAATVEVTAANLAFAPASVTVHLTGNEPGFAAAHAHVVWTVADVGTQHTVTFDDPKVASSAPLGAGQRHEALVYLPGTYTYRCTIHPAMTGTVVVTPEAATTATTTPEPAAGPSPGAGDASGSSGAGVAVGIGVAGLAVAAAAAWLVARRRRPPSGSGGG